jgi:hypothetical protein
MLLSSRSGMEGSIQQGNLPSLFVLASRSCRGTCCDRIKLEDFDANEAAIRNSSKRIGVYLLERR